VSEVVRIPDETVNRIRQNTNILDVVSQYVQLKKSGQNHFAHCPFHEDNTPSFSVNEKKQIFHCFSCKRGGNVFKFLQEMEDLSFPESVFKVADMSNFSIDESLKKNVLHGNTNTNPKKTKLFSIHDKAVGFYHHLLMNAEVGKGPFDYLLNRGLKEDTLEEFNIGYSPKTRNALYLYLNTIDDLDIDEDIMFDTGIFSEKKSEDENELKDRFGNRIVFPIQDLSGNTVGFSGRAYDEQQENDYKRAKYLNSPETEIFTKSNVLFNYKRAKSSIQKENEAILFEGFMDVISSWQAGVKNGVASMGTSLTPQHIKAIERITNKIVVAYDGDSAGTEATKRIVDYLDQNSSLAIEVVSFPKNLDPDEFIQQKGVDKYQEFIRQNRDTFFSFLMRYYRKDVNLNNEAQRIDYIELMIKLLSRVSSPVERDMYIKQLVEEFDLSYELISEQVQTQLMETKQKRIDTIRNNRRNYNQFYQSNAQVTYNNKPKLTTTEIAERMLLNRLFYNDEVWGMISNIDENFAFAHDQYQRIYILFESFIQSQDAEVDDFIDFLSEDNLKELVTNILWIDINTEPTYYEISDYIQEIAEKSPIQGMISEKKQILEEAKRTGDSQKQLSLTIEITDLYRKLKNKQNNHG